MSKSGVVSKVNTNARGAYSILVNEEWVSCGFNAPPCKEGDYVTFDTTLVKGKYLTLVDGSMKASQPSAPAAKAAVVQHDQRNHSIIWQSCQKVAVQLLGLKLNSGVLKLGTKKGLQEDILMDEFQSLVATLAWDALNANITEPQVTSLSISADTEEGDYLNNE